MNIESIEQGFERCVSGLGGKLRPSEPAEFSPIENEDILGLPALLQRPRIWINSKHMYLGVHPWPTLDSVKLDDDEFLAFPRYPVGGNLLLMNAIDRGLATVSYGTVMEYGGTRRRLAYRPKALTAGIECTLPHLLLNASTLLSTSSPGIPTGFEVYEHMALEAAENIARYGLNHDRYINCKPSDLDCAVPAISDALEGVLREAQIPYEVARVGDKHVLRVTDEMGLARFWAPPTTEALVFPRRPERNPRMPVSLYPGPVVDHLEISVTRVRPEGNPTIAPIEVMTGLVDDRGRLLSSGHVEFISVIEMPNDHRTGMVNHAQNRPITWKGDGSYTKEFDQGQGIDSIPESFPNDPDRAYCTILRMCAELLAHVYPRVYRLEESTPPIEPLARAIRPSTDRLVEIVAHAGSISSHKKVEGLQQLIIFHLNQPHAFAALANILDLGRLFPRAKSLWEALEQNPILEDDQSPCTDGYISANVRMPEIQIDNSSGTYRLEEPTGIKRVTDYAQRVVGIKIPNGLSLLGKLAWLYEPIV